MTIDDTTTGSPAHHAGTRLAPILLRANQPSERPYRGGLGIARFRGVPAGDEWTPEDFLASVTEVHSGHGVGLTLLDDGRSLREAIRADPLDYLGPAHVEAFGADPALLVKLLDTRERLFVHFHPSTAFAKAALGAASGKTEAWIVLSTDEAGYAYLGFNRDVSPTELLDWFERQDSEAMLDAMHRVELAPGDTLYVPATVPHAIGPGITLVELQQPVDLSIILEYKGFRGLDAAGALLGLDATTALDGLERSATSAGSLEVMSASRSPRLEKDGSETVALFPEAADRFFRAERIRVAAEHPLEAGFSVLVIAEGAGSLEWLGGTLPVVAGQAVMVPYDAGETVLRGPLTAFWCRPPAPPTEN